MLVYNGDLRDIYNIDSHSYLQINNCGIHHLIHNDHTTFRKMGRVDYHLLYIVSGKCKVYFEGKTHIIRKGFVIYPPNLYQKYIDYKGTKRIWVHFNGYNVEDILKDAGLEYGVHNVEYSKAIEFSLLQLISEHNKKISISIEKPLLTSILYNLGKQLHNISDDEKVDKAILHITNNYNEKLNIKELATLCHLSKSRFAHIFKEQTGMSPITYCQKLRIENAVNLLLYTKKNISEISELCGYDDPHYFSRAFKKITNMSPKEYRNSTKIER